MFLRGAGERQGCKISFRTAGISVKKRGFINDVKLLKLKSHYECFLLTVVNHPLVVGQVLLFVIRFTAKFTPEWLFVGVTAANVILKKVFVYETSIAMLTDVTPIVLVSSKVLFKACPPFEAFRAGLAPLKILTNH